MDFVIVAFLYIVLASVVAFVAGKIIAYFNSDDDVVEFDGRDKVSKGN